jgi:hypothetical protein
MNPPLGDGPASAMPEVWQQVIPRHRNGDAPLVGVKTLKEQLNFKIDFNKAKIINQYAGRWPAGTSSP